MSQRVGLRPRMVVGEGYVWELESEDCLPLLFVRQRSTVLSNAQIKALPTTAVEVLPPPAENQAYVLVSATFLGTFPVSYGSLEGQGFGEDLQIYYDGDGGGGRVSEGTGLSGFFDADPDYQILVTVGPGQYFPRPPLNAKFTVRVTNGGSGDFTGGNDANTMVVTIAYLVIDLTTGQFVQ